MGPDPYTASSGPPHPWSTHPPKPNVIINVRGPQKHRPGHGLHVWKRMNMFIEGSGEAYNWINTGLVVSGRQRVSERRAVAEKRDGVWSVAPRRRAVTRGGPGIRTGPGASRRRQTDNRKTTMAAPNNNKKNDGHSTVR